MGNTHSKTNERFFNVNTNLARIAYGDIQHYLGWKANAKYEPSCVRLYVYKKPHSYPGIAVEFVEFYVKVRYIQRWWRKVLYNRACKSVQKTSRKRVNNPEYLVIRFRLNQGVHLLDM